MATGVQVYTSADAGAPQLYGAAGKLTDILDAVLVNGYGSRTPAGTGGAGAWSIVYTGTNKRVYRPSAGNRLYLRVRDDAGGTGGAQEALIKGAESFSDVDTATNPIPSTAQSSSVTQNSLCARKSNSTDSVTARPWIIIADDRTVYMFVATTSAGAYFAWMWGDFYSVVSGDSYRTMIIGRATENTNSSANPFEAFNLVNNNVSGALPGHFIQRVGAGTGTSITTGKDGGIIGTSLSAKLGGAGLTYPNTGDNGLYLSPVFVFESGNSVRGRMRGFWNLCHSYSSFNDGDTFSGVGDLAGRTFRIIKTNASGDGCYVIETSDTWDTSS